MFNFKEHCKIESTDSKIKFEEKGKSIVFVNSARKPYIKVQVDGCQIVDGEKCDNLLVDEEVGNEYFVELKGTDVAHALRQLDRSISLLSDKDNDHKYVRSYIISTNVSPKVSSKIQLFIKKWSKALDKRFSLTIKENRYEVML